ncbi:MAG: DUF4142 domain-containing protein [Panacagrimonas sp.]
MRTALMTAFTFRPLYGACVLAFLFTNSHVVAQDGPGRGVTTGIDQFVTIQDGASGFGGVAQEDDQLNEADRAFLIEAHQIEMLQVHAAAVAQKEKTTQAVQSHARRVLATHQASLVVVEKIGRDHGVELERRFTAEFGRRAEALHRARKSSFGPVFFGQMLELHGRMVALYEQAASTTDNADLRSLVEDSLPTLRTQLADAVQFSTTLETVATP